MSVSCWCSTPPGITSHASQHAVCQMRQDAGHIPVCGCTEHGGHTEKADPCPT